MLEILSGKAKGRGKMKVLKEIKSLELESRKNIEKADKQGLKRIDSSKEKAKQIVADAIATAESDGEETTKEKQGQGREEAKQLQEKTEKEMIVISKTALKKKPGAKKLIFKRLLDVQTS